MIERREGEGMTEFTMRRIRHEIVEECARLVDARARHVRAVVGAFAYSGPRRSVIADVIEDVAKDIRGLADSKATPLSPDLKASQRPTVSSETNLILQEFHR